MSKTAQTKPAEITPRFIRLVVDRVAQSKRVRRRLPVWGRLHIDRPLPFLTVYRRPNRLDDVGTDRLATMEAAYVAASGHRKFQAGLAELVQRLAEVSHQQFGAFLLLELWSAPDDASPVADEDDLRPQFRVLAPRDEELNSLVTAFEAALSRVVVRKQRATVRVARAARRWPKGLPPLLGDAPARSLGCVVLGLEVHPIYRAGSGGQLYPLHLRELCRGLSQALRRTFFEFTRTYTSQRPKHFHVLGRHAVVKAVWEVDRQLAEVAGQFDLLLLTTPVNATQAWSEFQRRGCVQAPIFRYRPVPLDPSILKRQLFAIPLERVEDPALALLFRQKQDELDRQITMLTDLNTRRFLHGSLQLYGDVNGKLLELAKLILARIPPRTRDDAAGGLLDANAFARRAEDEIAYYKQVWPKVDARVEVRDDMHSGLMVSKGSLLVGKQTRIPASRAEALLQHEVGTHVLTYYNGRAQPFQQLYSGLAGYDELQEGLAVLAEYLVGGLSRPRLRLLAARVVAAQLMISGTSFIGCYRELSRRYQLAKQTAFTVTMRIFRGGGLTKDAVYLRGLDKLLGYLCKGGDFEPLFIGKIAVDHLPMMAELRWRGVLREPPLKPRYLNQPESSTRLERVRHCASVLDLIERKPS